MKNKTQNEGKKKPVKTTHCRAIGFNNKKKVLAAKRQLIRLNGTVQCRNRGELTLSTPTALVRRFCQSPHSHSLAFVIELFKFRIIQILAHFFALWCIENYVCASFCVKCDNRNTRFGVMSFQQHVTETKNAFGKWHFISNNAQNSLAFNWYVRFKLMRN